MNEVTALGVALGPGSFTSLRVGLAFAKGLTLARRIPLIGIPTLDILAHAQPAARLPLAVAIQAQPQPDQPPSAAVDGPSEGFVAEAVNFSAAASQPCTNPIASYAWNFGNGVTSQPSADPNASAIYDQPGVYQVTVVVMDTKGLSSSASLEISIDSRPQTGEWILGNTLPGTSITLVFGQAQFSGFAGCNSYSGSYSASDNGDGTYSVSASGMVSTGAICSEEVIAQEAAIHSAGNTKIWLIYSMQH